MVRKLSFKVDPPVVYHTFNYHCKKAEMYGFNRSSIDLDIRRKILIDTVESLISLFEIPNDFNFLFLRNESILNKALTEMTAGNIILTNSEHIKESYKQITNNIISLNPEPDDPLIFNISEASLLCFEDTDRYTGQKSSYDVFKSKLNTVSKPVVHADISLSVLSEALDFKNIYSYFFETKFGFGMRPGICIWIAKDEVWEKTITLYNTYAKSPPECICYNENQFIRVDADIAQVFVFGMIATDMYNKGIKTIRNEIKYKSIILHNAIKHSVGFEPVVKDVNIQSKNILCANSRASQEEVYNFFIMHSVELDVFMRDSGDTMIRIANYPAHSKEQAEYLADLIGKF